MTPKPASAPPGGQQAGFRGAFQWLLYSLFAIGTLARIAPLFDQGGRLLRQFPSEDGYLMLTIARNLALGHGMSTAAGTIPTNGTQPLFNLIEAVGFILVGGDKRMGVLFALVLQVLINIFCAFAIARLARTLLRDRPVLARYVPGLAAALWYVSSINVPHAMNCLETGLYGTLVVMSVHRWYQLWLARRSERSANRAAVQVGILLGLTFWARIDAAFLIGAITLTHLTMGVRSDGLSSARVRLIESVLMGGVSVAVASPWLLNNLIRFGSPMPISGTAQSAYTELGYNLKILPPKLFEYVSVLVPIPLRVELTPVVWTAALLCVLAYVAFVLFVVRRMNADERTLSVAVLLMAAALATYYGIVFGASHFVNRYLFPLSPFTALFAAVIAVLTVQGAGTGRGPAVAWAFGLVVVALSLVGHARQYLHGTHHDHFQVVEWVEANVPERTWVAAIQTGTLGFFHDRTINLDGKVNPDALSHKLVDKIADYVAYGHFGPEQGQIDYLADWTGLDPIYHRYPIFQQYFELIVNDSQKNLAVMRRRAEPLPEPPPPEP